MTSKSEGVKSPSKSKKLRGFPDFRESRDFAVSQTAREIADLRSISGRKDNKKGNSFELPEMSWWSLQKFLRNSLLSSELSQLLQNGTSRQFEGILSSENGFEVNQKVAILLK